MGESKGGEEPPNNSKEIELKPGNVWGGVSDPNLHNPESFRYLIHGINPMATMNISAQASFGKDISEDIGDQSINMTQHPEDLAKRVSLSMSIIDPDHLGTWGNAGLIVEAPVENVVITSPQDSGTANSRPDLLHAKKIAIILCQARSF